MPTLTEPLRFERRVLEKVWGGNGLARRLGFSRRGGGPVGETWEIVDRAEASSVVAVGEHRGLTLGQLMEVHAEELLGDALPGRGRRFPLLVKYIEAAERLSVQVHPDEEAAATLGHGAEPKIEAWYVIDVADGGILYAGLRPDVTREDLAALATGPEIEETLLRWQVRPGDCLLVPGGTVHAIGAGVTLLEVQQSSDTTYRLYDWGRVGLDGRPRPVHVPEALACIRFGREARGPAAPIWQDASPSLRVAALARCGHFAMDGLRVEGPTAFATEGSFRVLAVIEGNGEIAVPATGARHDLMRGDVWLLPAAVGEHVIEPGQGELLLVQMTRGA
ncbi:MAG: type I phosphomannose isomerase catalytic subunit [Planctomycetota bacterium]